MGARIPPFVLVIVGVVLTVVVGGVWIGALGPETGPWWALLFFVLLAVAMTALGGAVTIDPRPLILRRALAGAALVWLTILAVACLVEATSERSSPDRLVALLGLTTADGLALAGLAATTGSVTANRTGVFARLGAVVVFAIAILMASGVAVTITSLARAIWRAVTQGPAPDRLPWGVVIAVLALPVVTFTLASVGARRSAGGTFYAQAATNRRNSLLLVVALVGVVAATAEIIAVTLTMQPAPALWSAAIAIAVGLAAAAAASRFGANVILETAGAQLADPRLDPVLLNVVQELSIAAQLPMPRVYVIPDGSQNAFATGRDPEHASLAVTRGLLERMDREELQGVIGHEMGHIRNLDTRYALYVAVLVGLVAIATDGFLRMVVEGWRNGAFMSLGDDDNALAGLAMGMLVGLFLLIVAGLLRIIAPLFAALVQASTSREREYLADTSSVEFTRNPRALERALASIAADDDPLEAANRGTQHLWFRNPVKPGSDRRSGLLSTHPSLGARIDRLRVVQGLPPIDSSITAQTSGET